MRRERCSRAGRPPASDAVATWLGDTGDRFVRFDSGVWTELPTLAPTLSYMDPKPAVDAAGNMLVLGALANDPQKIAVERFDAGANRWDPPVTLGTLTLQLGPQWIRMAPCGRAVAAWTECQTPPSTSGLPHTCTNWVDMFE